MRQVALSFCLLLFLGTLASFVVAQEQSSAKPDPWDLWGANAPLLDDDDSSDDDTSVAGPMLRTKPELPQYKASKPLPTRKQIPETLPEIKQQKSMDQLEVGADALVRRHVAVEAYLTDLLAWEKDSGLPQPNLNDYLIAVGLEPEEQTQSQVHTPKQE